MRDDIFGVACQFAVAAGLRNGWRGCGLMLKRKDATLVVVMEYQTRSTGRWEIAGRITGSCAIDIRAENKDLAIEDSWLE